MKKGWRKLSNERRKLNKARKNPIKIDEAEFWKDKEKTKKRKEDDEPLVAKSRGKINPVRIEADGREKGE